MVAASKLIDSEPEGLYLRDLVSGDVVEIFTQNRVYRLVYQGDGEGLISGHPEFCPETGGGVERDDGNRRPDRPFRGQTGEQHQRGLERVRAMSGEQLVGIIDLFGMMQAPAVGFVQMCVKHSVHHRGQLSAYLRSMGGKVPSIYGPSADTQ